jgi:PAS domain S-box-containing protein
MVSDIAEKRYRQVLDSAVETGIITLNLKGIITGWSEGAHRILGWTEAEATGQSLSIIFPPEGGGARQWEIEMSAAVQNGRGGHEGWRLRKNGSRFWAIGETTPLFGRGNRPIGYVKVLRDRTEQRNIEQALREEKRVLEILNRASGQLARENDFKELIRLVTLAGAELLDAQAGFFVCPIPDEPGRAAIFSSVSGMFSQADTDWTYLSSFSRSPALFTTSASSSGAIDDLQAYPALLGAAGANLTVGSLLAVPVTSRNRDRIGYLFYCHPEADKFGDRSTVIARGLADEAAIALDNVRLFEAAQREIADRKRAEVALLELNSNLEKLVEERTEELHRNAEALRQAQKMEAVGQLTGGIAHDFNNLLQIVLGNLEILTRSLPEDMGRLRRATSNAMTGARRAASLTQRLLAFARRQPLNPKPLDVNTLVRSMLELVQRTLGEAIQIEVVLAAGLWRTETDPNELESALLNLSLNARDAMPDGGKLTIETSNAYLDEAYASKHAEVITGQYVSISVSDTGFGMDEPILSRVFEPFFTTKAEGKGTGLGLSQVYGFVKQSGGHVKIYSEKGEGTTVKIYLPRLAIEVEQTEVMAVQETPEAIRGEVILVVEDDADVRAYSVESLTELGYRVLEASDGPSALAILEASEGIHLIFTDVVLPGGMTGADIVRKAQVIRPGVKALFTTGYARNAIVHHGRLDKGVHLIVKPFTFDNLAEKVRDVLDE